MVPKEFIPVQPEMPTAFQNPSYSAIANDEDLEEDAEDQLHEGLRELVPLGMDDLGPGGLWNKLVHCHVPHPLGPINLWQVLEPFDRTHWQLL